MVDAARARPQAVLASFGIDAEAAAESFHPSAPHDCALLEDVGFAVNSVDVIPRPTSLPGGAEGLVLWLNNFRNGVLDLLPVTAREEAVTRTVDLLRPILADATGAWTAYYVRLRFHGKRSSG